MWLLAHFSARPSCPMLLQALVLALSCSFFVAGIALHEAQQGR
jgi:flagellar biosynthesis protein FliQ